MYPDLSRKIRVYVCSDATVIGRMMIKLLDDVGEDGQPVQIPSFRLVVAPSEKWLSKDRTNMLGKGVVNPKIDALINKIYEEKGE